MSLITAPLAAYHFQQIPVYSVIANALIIPLSALVIMPATIATFLFWPFGIQDVALNMLGYGVEWMLAIAEEISSWPYAAFQLPAWSLSSIILFITAGMCLYLLSGKARWLSVPVSCIAFLLILFYPRTEMLISDSGGLVMVRMGSDLYLSSAKRDKFEAENWVKRLGKAEGSALLFPKEGRVVSEADSITCGGNMCRIEKAGHKITVGNDNYALKQDCAWADIIVTSGAFRDRNCRARIFNKFTLLDSGAVEINNAGKITTVAQTLGVRPWSPRPERLVVRTDKAR